MFVSGNFATGSVARVLHDGKTQETFTTLTGAPDMSKATSVRGVMPGQEDYSEGYIAKTIEEQTAKLPSDIFLWAACGSIVGSLALEIAGEEKKAMFVGQWAPTFLILGLYNKLVKLHGSD